MLWLLPPLAFLGTLAAPEANGTLIRNGSCVAPEECREGICVLTYRPGLSLQVSTACCESDCSLSTLQEAEPEAQPNGVKCHYCSGDKTAPCDSVSVMNCTGNQTMCLTLNGTWHGASGEGNSVAWRNGSCVASEDCPHDNSISALTYSIGFGFWVNTTCCQGNCQAPTPLATLPASSTLSKFPCPACPEGLSGPCNHSFYMQGPGGETECVQLDLVSEEGGRNVSVRGCGTRDLCGNEAFPALPSHRLARRPVCSTSQRAVLDAKCHSGAAPGLRLALPLLMVALGTAALS